MARLKNRFEEAKTLVKQCPEGSGLLYTTRAKYKKLRQSKCHSDIPEVAKAFGGLQGLLLAKEEGWSKVWYESDARNIILRLNNPNSQSSHWAAEGIIYDILNLKNELQEVHFSLDP